MIFIAKGEDCLDYRWKNRKLPSPIHSLSVTQMPRRSQDMSNLNILYKANYTLFSNAYVEQSSPPPVQLLPIDLTGAVSLEAPPKATDLLL